MGSINQDRTLDTLFNRVQSKYDVLQCHLNALHAQCGVASGTGGPYQIKPSFDRTTTQATSSLYSEISEANPFTDAQNSSFLQQALEAYNHTRRDYEEANATLTAAIEVMAHRERVKAWAESSASVIGAGNVREIPTTNPIFGSLQGPPESARGSLRSRAAPSQRASRWDTRRDLCTRNVHSNEQEYPYASPDALPSNPAPLHLTATSPPLPARHPDRKIPSHTMPSGVIPVPGQKHQLTIDSAIHRGPPECFWRFRYGESVDQLIYDQPPLHDPTFDLLTDPRVEWDPRPPGPGDEYMNIEEWRARRRAMDQLIAGFNRTDALLEEQKESLKSPEFCPMGDLNDVVRFYKNLATEAKRKAKE